MLPLTHYHASGHCSYLRQSAIGIHKRFESFDYAAYRFYSMTSLKIFFVYRWKKSTFRLLSIKSVLSSGKIAAIKHHQLEEDTISGAFLNSLRFSIRV